jgi:hypothetical protein
MLTGFVTENVPAAVFVLENVNEHGVIELIGSTEIASSQLDAVNGFKML